MKKFLLGFIIGAVLFAAIPIGAAISEYKLAESTVKITVDGSAMEMENPPILYMSPGYNYIPAKLFREICAKIGVGFEWVSETNTIEIVTEKEDAKESAKEDDEKMEETKLETGLTMHGLPIFMNEKPPLEKEGDLYCFTYEGTKYVLLDLSIRPKKMPYKYERGFLRLEKSEVINDEIVRTVILPEIPYGEYYWENFVYTVTYDYYINTLLPVLISED